MNNGKTLLFHIGTAKTGSTALHHFLSKNKVLLQKNGWDYPDLVSELTGVCSVANRGIKKNGTVFFDYDKRTHLPTRITYDEEIWNTVWKCIKEHLANYSVIISEEVFWQYSDRLFWERIIDERVPIKVVVYLRRQDYFMESLWQQRIKLGRTHVSLSEFASKQTDVLNYYTKISEIADIIGKENIFVREYIEKHEDNNWHIENDFSSVLGVEFDKTIFAGEEESKLRINHKCLEMKRVLNEELGAEATNWHMNWMMEQVSRHGGGTDKTEKFYFSLEERKRLLAKYKEENDKVASEYMGKKNGCLFPDELPKNKQKQEVFDEEIVRIFALMVNELNNKYEDIKNKQWKMIQNMIRLMAEDRQIVLFGAGKNCRMYLEETNMRVGFIVDNDPLKYGAKILNCPVVSVDNVIEWDKYFIIITPYVSDDIEAQLIGYGLKKEKNFCILREYI